jgi:hypothetical protein
MQKEKKIVSENLIPSEKTTTEAKMPAGKMEETPSGGSMPMGKMEETPSEGSMPVGKMPAATGNEMPVGSMKEPTTTATEMPAAKIRESEKTRNGMPTGNMEETNPDTNRFRPANIPPGEIPPTTFEPGVVEVEFREGVRPNIIPATARSSSVISSPEDVDLTGLNQILQKYQLEKAEPSFQTSEQEASRVQLVAKQQGVDVPNFGNFVTLHFPEDSDTQRIAQELSQLPEVERAVAVPKAIPPQLP